MRRLLLAIIAVALMVPASAGAATLHATTANFASVYAGSAGGDTILLASGNYGAWGGGTKSSMVTIAPESGASPTFSGGTFDTTVRNLTIQGVTYTGMTRVNPPTGTLMNLVFDGDTWGNISCPLSGGSCADKEGRLAIIGGGSNSINSAGVQVKNSTFGPGGCSDGMELGGNGAEVGPNNEFMNIVQGSCGIHTDSVQFYAGDYVNFHDNWIHGGDQGIMAPDGGTGEVITNNAIIADNNYDIVAGNWDSSTIQHNYADADIYDGNPANQPGCGSHNSTNDVYRDNVGSLDGCGTNITSDHNLAASSVTFAGGSGRCQWATASPTGTASDSTNIGMNCGTVIDTTAPDTSITTPPSDGTSTSASIPFTGTDNVGIDHFECRIDGGSYATCTSPKTYSALSVGSHTFDVRAVDTTGNADPTPASATWSITTVDTTPPDTTINSGPSDPTSDNTPTFTFSSSESGSTFECKVDAGSFASCTSPFTTSALSDGSHTFSVSATDASSNTDATPASQTFTVATATDHSVTAAFSASPSPSAPNQPNTFDATSTSCVDAPCSYVWYDDPPPDGGTTFPLSGASAPAGQWSCNTDCSILTFTFLGTGTKYIHLTVTDADGDSNTVEHDLAVNADTTAPNTTITTAPSSGSSTSASIPFTGTDNVAVASFECKLDAGSYAACTSPKAYSGLANGSHTFSVRAKDANNNVDATPATATWSVTTSDSTPPDTSITTAPSNSTSTSASIPFTGTDNVAVDHYECKLDAGAYATCTSPKAYSGLSLGSHTFSVRAYDAAGNVDATPATATWSVLDGTPPDTSITTAPSDGTSTSASIPFTGTDDVGVDHFECKIDAGAYATCTSPKAYSGLSTGSHTFSVRAHDAAGNVDATPATATWTISAAGTKPTYIDEHETAWTTSTSPKSVTFTANSGNVLVAYAMSEDGQYPLTISGSGLTWTLKQSYAVTGNGALYMWTATAASTSSVTVTFTRTSGAGYFGGNVLRFSGSSGIGASVVNHSTGGPDAYMTTTSTKSAVVSAAVDWNAGDGTTRAMRNSRGESSITSELAETTYARDSSRYTVYGGYWNNVSPNDYHFGWSLPIGQKYTVGAVEVKGT